jgi:hypothetical protein
MQVTFPESPNAELLKRVAHAVDGVRTGEEIFLVVQTQPPYRVIMVTTDEEKADKKVAETSSTGDRTYIKVGPFRTKTDRESLPRFTLLGHGPDSDPENGEDNGQRRVTDCYFLRTADFESPEGGVRLPKGALDLTDESSGSIKVVEKIHVSWEYREFNSSGEMVGDGRAGPEIFAWKPDATIRERPMVDCLFFSVAAAEMLLYPYLAHVHGSEHAAKEREKTLNQI